MRALVYHGPWQMELEELPRPSPAAGEVLLRITAVGICGSDVHGFTGESGRRTPGMVMGHEFAGEIAELGPGVEGWQVGERVAAFNMLGCGQCLFCRTGQTQQCPERQVFGVNMGTRGAFAEFLAVPGANLVRLAPGLDPALAVLHEPLGVGLHAVDILNPSPTDTVVVVGAGTIGLGLTLALRQRGVARIFVLDKIPEKLALAERFGATPVHVEKVDPQEVLRAATGGYGADGAVEAVGQAGTVRECLRLTRPGGTVVLVGNLAQSVDLPLQEIVSQEKRLLGSYGFHFADFQRAMALINGGGLPLEALLTGECTLEETPAVMAALARGERLATKIVVRLEGGLEAQRQDSGG